MIRKIICLFKNDIVLLVSLCLALLSCLITPPGPAYLGYIDFHTLILLFCLMLIVEGLREAGFFLYIGGLLLNRTSSRRGLALTLVFLCFLSSMFITNDVSLITFVPFGILILKMGQMESRICYLTVLMTIAANLGSMFTPIGNPQNLYLYSLSGMSYRTCGRASGSLFLLWNRTRINQYSGRKVLVSRQKRSSVFRDPFPFLPVFCRRLSARPGTSDSCCRPSFLSKDELVCKN